MFTAWASFRYVIIKAFVILIVNTNLSKLYTCISHQVSNLNFHQCRSTIKGISFGQTSFDFSLQEFNDKKMN